MPIYTYRCIACTAVFDILRSIKEMRAREHCPVCNKGEGTRHFVPHHVTPDLPGYSCPITGKWIDGRRAHIDNLKRNGCRVLEKGEREEYIKRKEDRQRDTDRRTEAIVEKAAREMGLIR